MKDLPHQYQPHPSIPASKLFEVWLIVSFFLKKETYSILSFLVKFEKFVLSFFEFLYNFFYYASLYEEY